MPITGATRLFPIIGHPVAGVFSPPAFNRHFEENDIDTVMFGLDIAPDGLHAFWDLMRASSNMLGCSVTYPHKQAAFAAVDSMTERAQRLGALNTIRRDADGRLNGDATDGLAMLSAILEQRIDPAGMTAHVIGAGGGAGLAIIDALCERDIGWLLVEESDPARLENLLRLLKDSWPDVGIHEGCGPADILINATTLGKSEDDPLPFPLSSIETATLCCDVVTAHTDTPFIAAARKAGRTVVDGNAMGAGQLTVQLDFIGL